MLLNGHIGRVFMGISVQTNLVSGVANRCHLGRERLERMSRDKPGSLDVMFGKEPQYTLGADSAGEETWVAPV